MRRRFLLALVTITALAIAGASPLVLRAQVAGAPGRGADDMPHRTAKAFAPFFRAILLHRINTAQGFFKMKHSVSTELETPENIDILSRINKPDNLELNLIGGRNLGNNIGILFFTIATQDGPIAFKIYFYGFDKDVYIDRMDITDDWDTIEQTATTLEMLPSPITTPISGEIDDNGGGQ